MWITLLEFRLLGCRGVGHGVAGWVQISPPPRAESWAYITQWALETAAPHVHEVRASTRIHRMQQLILTDTPYDKSADHQ